MQRVRVVTYFPVDIPHASTVGSWQQAQLDRLCTLDGWRPPAAEEGLALQAYGHAVLDELLQSMPSVALEMRGGVDLLERARLHSGEVELLTSPSGGWSLVDVRLSLWNMGVALAELTHDISLDVAPEPGELAAATRGHSYALTGAVQALVEGLLVEESAPVVLWANPVYLLQVDQATDARTRWELASAVTANGLDCRLEDHPGSALRVGRHCSAVSSSPTDPSVDVLLRLIGAQQVCWGVALLYDAWLSRELAKIRPQNVRLTIRDLESQATRILTTYHLVRLFRLRYGAVEAHLDTGASIIWVALEKNWKFPNVLANLDSRLDFVQTFHAQLLTRLQDERAQLLNQLVLAFTFLNLFSIGLAALTFAELKSLAITRAAAGAMGLILLANAAIYVYFRRRTQR